MRNFEVIAVKIDARDGKPIMMVCMDLESYREALENFLDKLADESYNAGFAAGNSAEEEE